MTDRQVLLKKQKNQLFKIIEEAGLNPGSFEWTEERVEGDETDHVISQVSYGDSMYFYRFDLTMTRYLCKRCPGHQNTTGLARFAGWSAVVSDFSQWVKRLKAEIDVPDLWAASQRYQSIFALP